MRHGLPPAPPRPVLRRGLTLHRPRPPVRGRGGGENPVRASDLILALLGVTLLGALALMAGVGFLGHALGH